MVETEPRTLENETAETANRGQSRVSRASEKGYSTYFEPLLEDEASRR